MINEIINNRNNISIKDSIISKKITNVDYENENLINVEENFRVFTSSEFEEEINARLKGNENNIQNVMKIKFPFYLIKTKNSKKKLNFEKEQSLRIKEV